MKVNDVVQFIENHKWCGCLGIIEEDKGEGHPRRYLIGVPILDSRTAFIYDDGSSIEYVGKAVMIRNE